MTKRKNPFERIKQHYVTDGQDINWWLDDGEDWEWFQSEYEELMPDAKQDERIISGAQYNKWIVENVYGDYEGRYVDEDCPECGHFLVYPFKCEPSDFDDEDDPKGDGTERHCSNRSCKYDNESLKIFFEKEKKKWNKIRNEPEVRIRETGQTLEEFIEKYGFSLKPPFDKRCVICNRIISVSDFYRVKGYAIISWSHEDCDNGGPSVAIPLGKTREKWGSILGF